LKLVKYHWIEKALTKLAFYKEEATGDWCLYYSDKFGDLRRLALPIEETLEAEASAVSAISTLEEMVLNFRQTIGQERRKDNVPLLGHISFLTDFTLTDTWIISMDRDEKIRVSSRSCPFVVLDYWLGHTAYISTHVWLQEEEGEESGSHPENRQQKTLLLTGGGDDALFLWDTATRNKSMIPARFPLADFLHREATQWNVQCLFVLDNRPHQCSTVALIVEEFKNTIFILALENGNIILKEEICLGSTPELDHYYAYQIVKLPCSNHKNNFPSSFLICCYDPVKQLSRLYVLTEKIDPSSSHLSSYHVVPWPLSETSAVAGGTCPLSDFLWRKSSLRKYFEEDQQERL